MRLEVNPEERQELLEELDGFIGTAAALYRAVGREWDPREQSGLPPDVALVARAHEQLAGEGPWQLEGTTGELELLLGRLRAASELALQRGTHSSPSGGSVAMNTADTEATDAQLDLLRICDSLMERMGQSGS